MPRVTNNGGSKKASTAITYVTIGALLLVWGGLWNFYLFRYEGSIGWKYVAFGILLTGLAFAVIGILLGRIGKAANEADESPEDEKPDHVHVHQDANAPAPTPPAPGTAPPSAAPVDAPVDAPPAHPSDPERP